MDGTELKLKIINDLNEKFGIELLEHEKCKNIFEGFKREYEDCINEVRKRTTNLSKY